MNYNDTILNKSEVNPNSNNTILLQFKNKKITVIQFYMNLKTFKNCFETI